jgi:Xaa-Pro aminopeptidase
MPKLRISWKEYGRRLEHAKSFMGEKGYDAMLVTSGVHIFYLSHFYHMTTERPAALVVPAEGEITWTTRGRPTP